MATKPGINYEILVNMLAKIGDVELDNAQVNKEIEKTLLAFTPKQFRQEVPVDLQPDVKLTSRSMRQAQKQVFDVFSELQHAFPSTKLPPNDALADLIRSAGITGKKEVDKLTGEFNKLGQRRIAQPEQFANLAETLSRINALDLDALDKLESKAGQRLVKKAQSGSKLSTHEKSQLAELEAVAATFGKQLQEATQPLKSTKTKVLKTSVAPEGFNTVTRTGKNAPAIITSGLDKVTKSLTGLTKTNEKVAADAEKVRRADAIAKKKKDSDFTKVLSARDAQDRIRTGLDKKLSDRETAATELRDRQIDQAFSAQEKQTKAEETKNADRLNTKADSEIKGYLQEQKRDLAKHRELAKKNIDSRERIHREEATKLNASRKKEFDARKKEAETKEKRDARTAKLNAARGDVSTVLDGRGTDDQTKQVRALLNRDVNKYRGARDLRSAKFGPDDRGVVELNKRYQQAVDDLERLKLAANEAAQAKRVETSAVNRATRAKAAEALVAQERLEQELYYSKLAKRLNKGGRDSLTESERDGLSTYLKQELTALKTGQLSTVGSPDSPQRNAELERTSALMDNNRLLQQTLKQGTPDDMNRDDEARFRRELAKQRTLLDTQRGKGGNDWVLGVPAEQWKSTVGELKRESRELQNLLNSKGSNGEKLGAQADRNRAGQKLIDNDRAISRLTKTHGDYNEKLGQGTLLLRQFMRYAVGYGALYSAAAAVTALVRGLVDLDKQLYAIKAIGNLTASEMDGVQASIERTAISTKFTVSEIAQATQVLVQAGVAGQELNSALQGTALFASATGSDLALAADLVTTYRNVFTDLNDLDIANQLTSAINISKLTAADLKTILSISAQVSESYNLTSEQYLAAVTTLRNAGLKASTVATGLRQGLFELFAPDNKTIKALKKRYQEVGDELGSASSEKIRAHFYGLSLGDNGLTSVLKELGRLGITGAGKETLGRAFDIRAFNAISALVNDLSGLETNEISISFSNSAAKASATQMESFANSLDNLGAAITSFSSSITGGLIRDLEDATDYLTNIVKGLKATNDELKAVTGSGYGDVAGATALGAVAGGIVGKGVKGTIAGTLIGGVVGNRASIAATDNGVVTPELVNAILTSLGVASLFGKGAKGATNVATKGVEAAAKKGVNGLSGKAFSKIAPKLTGLLSLFSKGWVGLLLVAATATLALFEGSIADFFEKSDKGKAKGRVDGASAQLGAAIAKLRGLTDDAGKFDQFSENPDGTLDAAPDNLMAKTYDLQRQLGSVNDTITKWFGQADAGVQTALDRLAASSGDIQGPEFTEIIKDLNAAAKAPIGNGSSDNASQLKELADARSKVNSSLSSVVGLLYKDYDAYASMSEAELQEIANATQVRDAFEKSTRKLSIDVRSALRSGFTDGYETETVEFVKDYLRELSSARAEATQALFSDATTKLNADAKAIVNQLLVSPDDSGIRAFTANYKDKILPALRALGIGVESFVEAISSPLEDAKFQLEQELAEAQAAQAFAVKGVVFVDSNIKENSAELRRTQLADTRPGADDLSDEIDDLKDQGTELQERKRANAKRLKETSEVVGTLSTRLRQLSDTILEVNNVVQVQTNGATQSSEKNNLARRQEVGNLLSKFSELRSDPDQVKQNRVDVTRKYLAGENIDFDKILDQFDAGDGKKAPKDLEKVFLLLNGEMLSTTETFKTFAAALKRLGLAFTQADKDAAQQALEARTSSLRKELEALKNQLAEERTGDPTGVAYSGLPARITAKSKEVLASERAAINAAAVAAGQVGEDPTLKKLGTNAAKSTKLAREEDATTLKNRAITIQALKRQRDIGLGDTSFTESKAEDARRVVVGNPFNQAEQGKELRQRLEVQKEYRAKLQALYAHSETTDLERLKIGRELVAVSNAVAAAQAKLVHITGGLAYQMELALDSDALINKIEDIDGGMKTLGNRLQGETVTAVDELGNAFGRLVVDGEHFGRSAEAIFRNLLQSIARTFAEQGFNELAGVGVGLIKSGITSALGSFSGPDVVNGGSAQGAYGGGFSGFAEGGVIKGKGTGTSDSILGMIRDNGAPIMVSNGESILTAKATSMMGEDLINALNRGQVSVSKYAQGGVIGKTSSVVTGDNNSRKINYESNITIPVSVAGGKQDTKDASGLRQMDAMVTKKVRDIITHETRQGGLLNR